MVIVRKKKLWQGKFVSIRDYELVKGMAKGGLRIEYNGDVMQLGTQELKNLHQATQNKGKSFQSKFKGQYKLIDVPWIPATTDPRQGVMI